MHAAAGAINYHTATIYLIDSVLGEAFSKHESHYTSRQFDPDMPCHAMGCRLDLDVVVVVVIMRIERVHI